MEASALRHPGVDRLRGPTPLLRLQSDERLVALTRRGNASAYEVLVARYQSRLLAFCRHMLGSREDAEDVLQEVFAAGFHAMVADDRPLNVRPWLYRIARNRSLNHLRRTQAIGVDSMDHHLSEHGTTTADKVHRREEFRQLVADVQDLAETQRTALLLREIDALSYEQIAEAMETTVPSVKSLLVRARVSLAEAAEARKLTCEEVREELGAVAEGLASTTPPVRRHLRGCDRCASFRKELRRTNRALAAVLPVGPLLILKKLLLAHAGAGAGSAAASASAGSAVSAGASAVASKAVATVAAAAIVTAGAVEVEHVRERSQPAPAVVAAAPPVPASAAPIEPQVVASVPQPTVAAPRPRRAERPARESDAAAKPAALAAAAAAPAVAADPLAPPDEGASRGELPPAPGATAASGGVAAPQPPPPPPAQSQPAAQQQQQPPPPQQPAAQQQPATQQQPASEPAPEQQGQPVEPPLAADPPPAGDPPVNTPAPPHAQTPLP